MGNFFTGERIGTPQIVAGIMLLIFVAECAWLVAHLPAGAVSADEFSRVQEGLAQWRVKTIAGTNAALGHPHLASVEIPPNATEYDPQHSPLWYLIETAPLAISHADVSSTAGVWLSRAPYVCIGVLLGASLWYVSRRLYGNAGGYIALALYCFSPAVIRSSALWLAEPDIAGAWGTFGAVFTAIAVSHTLYAPREVVLWNWRRIVLLGISLALAAGSQFSLVIIIPVLLIFMLYVAAERWAAAVVILLSGCAVGCILLFASYFLHVGIFLASLAQARWFAISWPALAMRDAWLQVGMEVIVGGPVLVLLAPAALAGYVLWPRTRYFGNTAPLAVLLLFVLLRVASPHSADSVFSFIALIFVFLFVSGIAADVLETRYRELSASLVIGLLAANAIWNLVGLAGVR